MSDAGRRPPLRGKFRTILIIAAVAWQMRERDREKAEYPGRAALRALVSARDRQEPVPEWALDFLAEAARSILAELDGDGGRSLTAQELQRRAGRHLKITKPQKRPPIESAQSRAGYRTAMQVHERMQKDAGVTAAIEAVATARGMHRDIRTVRRAWSKYGEAVTRQAELDRATKAVRERGDWLAKHAFTYGSKSGNGDEVDKET